MNVKFNFVNSVDDEYEYTKIPGIWRCILLLFEDMEIILESFMIAILFNAFIILDLLRQKQFTNCFYMYYIENRSTLAG